MYLIIVDACLGWFAGAFACHAAGKPEGGWMRGNEKSRPGGGHDRVSAVAGQLGAAGVSVCPAAAGSAPVASSSLSPDCTLMSASASAARCRT